VVLTPGSPERVTQNPQLETAEAFAALARSLAELGGIHPTLEQVVVRAVDLVPCDWAVAGTAERLSDRRVRDFAGSDDLMFTVQDISLQAGTSPGWEAFRHGATEYSPDLTNEARYGSYPAAMVARTPIRSVLSFGLWLHERPLGVLTLYARHADAFDTCAQSRAALLADHATIAIEVATVADRAEHLQAALATNRSIGAAVGILTERHHVTPEHAFDLLRVVSQRSNRRLADIAEELVRTGHVSPSRQERAG
jgi:GAF domain-containing protein